MKMTVTVVNLVKLVIVISVLQLIYSNDIDEEVDPEPVEYLPSHHDITECVYVRHFGPYSGNISCPDTAAALTTIQTKRVGQSSGVGPSNQHLPNTNWSMQCDCPHWSHQPEGNPSPTLVANAHSRSTWRPFMTTSHHPNTSFNCNNNEFLSGLAYQYNQQSGNISWWGRCTRFHGYFIRGGGESCHDSAWRLPDGADNWITVTLPMTGLHGVEDYPIPQSSNSQLPSSGSSDNRREKKFQECTVSPIPGCDNPTIINGSTTLLPSLTSPTADDVESGGGRIKHGDSLQVSCNSGYYIYGPSVATCQINGSWTQLPTCKPCWKIRNCLSVECTHGNESFCLECKAHTDKLYYHIPLKFVLNKNRRRCRIVPHIDRRKVPSEPVILNKFSDTVRLDCPSVGRPVPTIKWTRNNRPLTSLTTNEERFDLYLRNLYSNGSLVLRYVHDTSDSGVYTCTAINDVGSDSVNITLISKEEQLRQELEGNSSLSAPIIHSKGAFMVFFQSNTLVHVYCNVIGNPQPTIKWYKLGVTEDKVRSIRVHPFYVFHIDYFVNETLSVLIDVDMGIYSCLATNKYGSDIMHKYICIGNSRDDCDPQ